MDGRIKISDKSYNTLPPCVKLEQLSGVCRACLSDRDLKNMFDVNYFNGKPEIYPEIIFSCFNIELVSARNDINDANMICENCIVRLRDAYTFKQQIESSLKLFEQQLEITILKNNDSSENISDLNFFGDETFMNESDDENYDMQKQSKNQSKATKKKVSKSNMKLKLKCSNNFEEVKFIEYEIADQDISEDSVSTSVKNEHKIIDFVKSESNADETFLNYDDSDINSRLKLPRTMKKDINVSKSQCNKKLKRIQIQKPYKLDKNDKTCKICNETFPLHLNLVRHLSVHYPNFICDVCGGVFSTSGKLKAHVIRHSNNRQSCPICNKSYKCRDNLKKHIKLHTDPSPTYKCPKCPQRFKVYYQRMKHLVDVHNDEPKKYKCKQCPKQYFVAGGLSRHVKRDHLQERNSICPVCGSAFFNKYGLSEHMLKHTGIKDFQCKICHKSFGRKYTLREHMKIHTNEKRFECSICNRRFTQKCTLTGHMNTHKKIQVAPEMSNT